MVLLAAAFGLGLVFGGASLALAARRGKADWIWRGSHGPARTPPAGSWAGSLDQRLHLGLTPSVRDSINVIAKRGRSEMDSITRSLGPAMDSLRQMVDSVWQRVKPEVDARRNETRTEIKALLTPVQREKFDSANQVTDSLREQRRQTHDQHGRSGPRGDRGPPGGPGGRGGFEGGPY